MIKIRLLQRLSDLIQCEVKALKDHVCAGPASRDHTLKFPSLSIVPGRFTFTPQQPDENNYIKGGIWDVAPKTTVFQVGLWEGTIELRLGEKTPFKRYELEYAVEQLFMGTTTGTDPQYRDPYFELRPGTLLIDVPECHGARCALMLGDSAWDNELVFTNEWYSVMTIQAEIPALIQRKPLHQFDTIELSLTPDLETEVVPPAVLPSNAETIVIDETYIP